jgi:hypothetical protein
MAFFEDALKQVVCDAADLKCEVHRLRADLMPGFVRSVYSCID